MNEHSPAPERVGLRRELTSRQIAMIGLSGALGTGLFLGSGSTIGVAGPAIVLSYVLSGLAALAVVWALAEMTVVHPVAGGFGTISASYAGRLGGWVARWNVAVTMCIAVGAEIVAATSYLQHWFPGLPLGLGTAVLGAALVVVNLATVRLYGASEYWFSLVKVVAVIAFVVLGVLLVVVGLPGHAATGIDNLTAHGGFAPFGLTGILTGAVFALFSFGGAENVSVAAAESEHPERDVPRAARAMIVRLVLFYVLAILVVVTIQPWTVSAQGHGTVQESPFVRVLDATGVPAAADIMNAVLITAALSAANGCLFAASRMVHALALDDMAPRWFARTSPVGAPQRAVLASSIGVVLAAYLAITSPDKAFMSLFGVNVFGLMITWAMVLITYIAFRTRRAARGLPTAPARLAGGRATAAVLLLLVVAVVISLASIEPLRIGLQAGIPYLCVLLALGAVDMWRHRGRRSPTLLGDEPALLDGPARG